VRLSELSLSELGTDELFLVSQIDGKSSIRELMLIAQMKAAAVARLMEHLLQRGYIVLESPPAPAAPPRKAASAGGVQDGRGRSLASGAAAGAQTGSGPRASLGQTHRDPAEQAEAFYSTAIDEYNQDDYTRAEELLRAALKLVPSNPLYRARLAIVLLERPGREREASQYAGEAVEEDPLMGQCYEALGLVKLRLGDVSEARRLLEQAVLLDRRHVPTSAALLEAIKSYKQKRGEPPDQLWNFVRHFVRLVP
jgi:tetratricopeptide (TPR) repeat protein